jgi:superfamily I DNA/RNA helicase
MNLLNLTLSEPSAGSVSDFIASEFQQAIFSASSETSDNLLIEAVAGSGKTTTILRCADLVSGPVLFLAFNKSIAQDIQGKLGSGEAKTLNALGHRLWMRNAPGARLDADKLEKLISTELPPAARKEFGYIIKRIIQALKNSGFGIEGEVGLPEIVRHISGADWIDVEDSRIPDLAGYVLRIFNRSRSDLQTFDFDDQLYGPIFNDWQFPHFGTVLVDEAQDLNRIQHLFVAALAESGARIIAVGDRHQAIYAFRGALHDSLDLLRGQFRMHELPLSISYRCPLSVIRQAQELVPHIQARSGAPEGKVEYREEVWRQSVEDEGDPLFNSPKDPDFWPDGSLIVCRNNAPLFSAVMRSVRARKPCRVLSNALEGLSTFIKKQRVNTISELYPKLDRWLEREKLAAEAKGMDWKVAALEDKHATILSLCEGFAFVDEVLNVLRQLSEGRSGPLFSTIHKAKGLEAESVYFLRPDLVPGWWVEKPAELQQEMNLRYVAITRAKQSLTYGVKKENRR